MVKDKIIVPVITVIHNKNFVVICIYYHYCPVKN